MLAFSLAIGNHFIAADHGARSRRDVLELATQRLLS
jgi:predicted NUDIX family phosphoesterase